MKSKNEIFFNGLQLFTYDINKNKIKYFWTYLNKLLQFRKYSVVNVWSKNAKTVTPTTDEKTITLYAVCSQGKSAVKLYTNCVWTYLDTLTIINKWSAKGFFLNIRIFLSWQLYLLPEGIKYFTELKGNKWILFSTLTAISQYFFWYFIGVNWQIIYGFCNFRHVITCDVTVEYRHRYSYASIYYIYISMVVGM